MSESEISAFSKYSSFFSTREHLVDKKSTHYLLVIGKEYRQKDYGFLSFESKVKSNIENITPKPNYNTIKDILNKVVSIYTYLYIPVETTVSDFLKLETAGMQTLVDKDIKAAISEALNEKRITRTTDKNRKKQISVLEIINEKLEGYIEQIQLEIQQIDSTYDFKPEYRQSSKLTPNHIANVIIEAFYSRRSLKKDKKPICNLSSGEKRSALIDIIYVFLSKNSIDRNLILAIDEPESSLHISKCYNQFRKIQDIALQYKQQLFITTHWYGSLPILKCGNLMHIESNQKISLFDLSNYFEDRGAHPNDINLKSFFDLAASIISAYRNSNCHWLLVEGSEDKSYLEYYLKDDSVQIIPLCGCSNVKKVYEYLFTPMSNKSQEIPGQHEPKILCLTDTDQLNVPIHVTSSTEHNQLMIRRWQENQTSHNIELLTIENPTSNPTEIEEILQPRQFYEALTASIQEVGSQEEKNAFAAFEFDDGVVVSRIKGDYSILNHMGNGRNSREDKNLINTFVDNNKHLIAEKYIHIQQKGDIPDWVNSIKELLNS